MWGYHPNSQNTLELMIHKWYPPQLNSRLGFINPWYFVVFCGVFLSWDLVAFLRQGLAASVLGGVVSSPLFSALARVNPGKFMAKGENWLVNSG